MGCLGAARESRFEEIQAGAGTKPGHSGRTGPRADRPRLASSRLLYRAGPPLGRSSLPLHQVSGRPLWGAGSAASPQLPTGPLSFPHIYCLRTGNLPQNLPSKKCLLFPASQSYSTRPCLKIHKQVFLGQINSYSSVMIFSVKGDCHSTGVWGGGRDFPNILGHRSLSERTDQTPPRSLWS